MNPHFQQWLTECLNKLKGSKLIDEKLNALTKAEVRKIGIIFCRSQFARGDDFKDFVDALFKTAREGSKENRVNLALSISAGVGNLIFPGNS